MLVNLFLLLWGALMSRAKGSGFWGTLGNGETTLGRLLAATGFMLPLAGLTYLQCHDSVFTATVLFSGIGLLWFFFVLPIDPGSSLAINGNNSAGQTSQTSEWIIDYPMSLLKIPTNTVSQLKIWGLAWTAIRMTWAAVPFVTVFALLTHAPFRLGLDATTPLLAFAYIIGGFIPASDQRATSELILGIPLMLLAKISLGV